MTVSFEHRRRFGHGNFGGWFEEKSLGKADYNTHFNDAANSSGQLAPSFAVNAPGQGIGNGAM